ncbi:MAG: DNA polymerase III subunit beta [Lachnospiraceae bacterium]|nr:DNA polymerase III subunit beta [Lachnospiraceae bacterium]
MKFIASKTDLMNSIAIALRAVPAHTTMPILRCILIEGRGNSLKLTTNDSEFGIETYVTGTVEDPGTIAVDAKIFSEIIRRLPDEIVNFRSDESFNIEITCGKTKINIAGQSGEEFAALPNIEMDDCITISQFTLKNLITQTIFSIASNDNNKLMSGELFEIKGSILRMVALDGHRIAIRRVALKEDFGNHRVIIPGKTLSELARTLSGEMDEVAKIYLSKNYIIFDIPGTRLVSRLIDGEYFNVDQMISSDYETKITINRQELQGCLDRAAIFFRENDKKPIVLDLRSGELELSLDTPQGSFNEKLDVEKQGPDMVIGLNPKFMSDALKVIEEESVGLYMINSKAPCFIRNEDETYVYLILPVNFVR